MLKKRIIQGLVWLLEAGLVFGVLYLVFAPAYPWLEYRQRQATLPQTPAAQMQQLQETGFASDRYSENTLVIPKIGVEVPIVEAPDERGLERGAWHMPETAVPGDGGNTVITAHRFKYLPPNNQTFYNLNRLAPRDTFAVLWEGKKLLYEVTAVKIVNASDTSIVANTGSEQITLFTCHPLFSTKKRFVVVAKPVSTAQANIR